jgi:RNA polymerase sigma-70 factor (ECF subfamily)
MADAASGLPSDEELACRAQAGCEASFEQLARRFQAPVLQFLRRLGAGPDAEDLLQETLVRACVNLHRYRPRWRFAAWLFTIARRASINHRRRAGAVAACRELESLPSRGPDPSHEAAEAEDRQRLWNTAARILSEEEMTAVWLFYVEDLSAREIAGVLERSWVSVKTMLFRARRRLLAVLQEPEPVGRASRKRAGCARNHGASGSPKAEIPHVRSQPD